MIATDAEVCEFRWYDRFGVYGEQEFARADSRLECNAIFYHVHEHPTLAVNCLDRTQGGVDRIGRRNTVAPLMKESCVAAAQCLEEFAHAGFKRFSFDLHETGGLLVDKRNPGIVILVWVADVNVSLRDEVLNRADDFGAILGCGDFG